MRENIMIKELKMKKILLGLLVLIVIAVGGLFAINGRSSYDPTRYHLSVTPENKPFGIGSSIAFTLPDQFDNPHTLPKDTRKLIFVFTKETGHIFRTWMGEHESADYLSKRHTVAVADVSGMPTVILNTFAMPDFRKSAYPILLIYDKQMAQRLKEGQAVDKVIVMTLKEGEVVRIDHADTPEALDKLL